MGLKRILAFIILLAVTVTVFSGCLKQNGESDGNNASGGNGGPNNNVSDKKDNAFDGILEAPSENQTDYSKFASNAPLMTGLDISISAKSAILCTDNGIVLYEKQADVPLPMASITKVMTAVVALEKIEDLKAEVTVPAAAVGVEGSSVYLKSGERVTFEMLLYSIMLESANDASLAIAILTYGDKDTFVKAMNERAEQLCMNNTCFKNPHGLSEDGHYTTARDYSKLMSYALQNSVFREIIGTKKKVFSSLAGEMTRVLTNHNRLLNTYKGMLGGKTGFTKISGRTLVTAAEKDKTELICVTINASDDWNDHTELFNKGFELVKTKLFTPEEYSFNIPVALGSTETVLCGIKSQERLTTERDAEITVKYYYPQMLFAPVEKGKAVGRIEVFVNGTKSRELVILAKETALAR